MATSEQRRATAAKRNGNGQVTPPKAVLNELGEKIFLDRYALKDMTKKSLTVGDTVIVCVNQKTRQREIGTVRSLHNGRVSIELRDGTLTEQGIEDVDKPLETRPEQMMEPVASPRSKPRSSSSANGSKSFAGCWTIGSSCRAAVSSPPPERISSSHSTTACRPSKKS
jgi:hypothetical protein